MNRLINYLSKYIPLSPELIEKFKESNIIKEYKKGSFLLKQGDISSNSFFVLEGCVRSYTIKNGEDKTIEFYMEDDPILPGNSSKDIESIHYLQCVEDTVVVVSSEEKESEIFKEYPELKEVCTTLSEILIDKIQKKFIEYKTSTPEERYRSLLLNKPKLIKRIPQYQIASYLGVKPESLSRIKKRLS